MADKIIKCSNYSKCRQKWNFIPIKGPNNTELCYGCGGNICFVCGKKWKKEENFSWVEDYDCGGNKVMVKAYRDMFRQSEKDENHPEGDLFVYYCDEHKSEGEKSPNKWTEADRKQLKKKKEQEKLEREEKLNSQKGLFYCQDTSVHIIEWKKIEGVEYGCIYFWGQENGRNFNLLVPDTHPDLASFKYKEKVKEKNGTESECIRYNLKQQFYLIEGVDNLPLEATSSNSSQFNVPDSFAKVVGLNHKITIIPADSQGKPEKNKPVENNPNDNPFNSLPKELNDKNLLQYFQENNIKSIEKEGENLIVECNDNSIFIKSLAISPELKGIEKFLQNKNSKKISLQELSKPSDTSPPTKSPEKNNNLWIGFGIGGVVIIAVIIGFIIKKKKKH